MKIPFKKKIALELFRQIKKNDVKLHELTYLFWETTLRCNLRCLHCGSDCKIETPVKDMPKEDFLRVIDEITPFVNPNKTMIAITGGEPLLRQDLESVGAELHKRGYPWGIVTNGMLLNEKRLKSLLQSGLRSATVSLDGLENSHNWMRNSPQSFKNAVKAISLLANTPNFRFDVCTCTTHRNISELEKIKNLLISLGLKEWRIFTVSPIGRAKNNPDMQLDNEQFRSVFEFIKKTKQEKKIAVNYDCEGFLGNYEGEVRNHFFTCRAGINIGSVLVDGSISACPDLRGNFIQGNIYKDNFWQVWNNRYQVFRDRSWAKRGICADCKVWRYCEGNGMHLHDDKGDLMFCHYNYLI
ncbi:MAG: TIGR04133 family radical SAM/SPASM protein [Prevotellaceae bacterium]|jgi:radical SAM enzyme (rSAM/lipoprotein system)|nr:TIGR04133 family radical SAM/SPASM protein [Prevotellaceae bacterium]